MPKREDGSKIKGLDRRSFLKSAPAFLLPRPRVSQAAELQRAGRGAWPIKPSPNGRYLVTSANEPFILVADSAQSMLGNLLQSDVEFFLL